MNPSEGGNAAKRQEAVLVARLLGWRKLDGSTSGTTGRITLIGVESV